MSNKKPMPLPRYMDVVYRLAGDKLGGFVSVYLAWKDVVGELLSEKSHPFKFENAILYVAVQNNTWMQELVLIKAKLIAELSRKCKLEIKDIYYMIRTKK